MLTIRHDVVDALVAHALRDHPNEACGIVVGPVGADIGIRYIPMQNVERSPMFYRFDVEEQLRVWREMDTRDEELVAIYHSHTTTEAYPSRTDIDIAGYPKSHHLLVSTRHPEAIEIRSFRIEYKRAAEELVRIANASCWYSFIVPRKSSDTGELQVPSDVDTHRPDCGCSYCIFNY